MPETIRRLSRWVRSISAELTGRRRTAVPYASPVPPVAAALPPDAPHPPSEPYPPRRVRPLPRRTPGAWVVNADAQPLVRPYVVAHEERVRREEREQRVRRVLLIAPKGVAAGPQPWQVEPLAVVR